MNPSRWVLPASIAAVTTLLVAALGATITVLGHVKAELPFVSVHPEMSCPVLKVTA